MRLLVLAALLGFATATNAAEVFALPTANRAILEKGGEARFFAGTPGKTWVSGTFGCVRSDGHQLHEGIDIRSTQHDRRGEPTDPVMASAEGVVAYVSQHAGLSNYGKYVVLRHRIEGMEIFTLYAHLSRIREGLRAGDGVRAGEGIATVGRTSNTKQTITKDRAHLHFEIDFLASDHFQEWFARNGEGQRNDHGIWNGRNLIGIDPRWLFLAQAEHGSKFSLVQFLRSQPMLFRARIRDPKFAWARRQPALVQREPSVERAGIAGYDVWINYCGLPYKLIPLSGPAVGSGEKVELMEVDENTLRKHPCRKLLLKRGASWKLSPHGKQLLDLLMF